MGTGSVVLVGKVKISGFLGRACEICSMNR